MTGQGDKDEETGDDDIASAPTGKRKIKSKSAKKKEKAAAELMEDVETLYSAAIKKYEAD